MNHSVTACAVLLLAVILPAQTHDGATQYVWVLDSGAQTSPAPVLRVYSPTGAELLQVTTVPGSGQARALDSGPDGMLYLCRGGLVHQLDTLGVATGVTLSPPTGASNAQDVLVTPLGEILVAWGTTDPTSAVTRYDATGVQLSNFADTGLGHPRRIAHRSDPADTTVYAVSRNNQTVVSFDYTAVAPTLATVVDLTSNNVGPIGLCIDTANDDLWVTSDWGDATIIGCVDLTTNVFSTAITYPPSGAAGLTAPAGLFYDRFRRLYVAGRSSNSGTAGVYVFEASSPTTAPTFLASWPRTGDAPTNVTDVTLQVSQMTTCSPTETTGIGTRNILEMGANNRVTFSSPETPGMAFAAAVSFRWQASVCGAVYQQGNLEDPAGTGLPFGGSDPRGLPFLSDDFFWSSVAVIAPGPSPLTPPINPATNLPFNNDFTAFGVGITGFLGDLDATGNEDGFIDLTFFLDPLNALGTDGMELTLAWVTFDLTEPALIGFVSQPLCVVLRNPDASPVVVNLPGCL
ncbi:MAG: hypothetical protein CMJ83_19880 [Planctomycetes bacterium]|nr:hypothetical protein [Planctomycetota bacterium]